MRTLAPILVALATAGAAACAAEPQWTADELENASHFLAAGDADIAAVGVSNSGGPGALSESERRQIVAYKRQALDHARAVRDDVLEQGDARASPALQGEVPAES